MVASVAAGATGNGRKTPLEPVGRVGKLELAGLDTRFTHARPPLRGGGGYRRRPAGEYRRPQLPFYTGSLRKEALCLECQSSIGGCSESAACQASVSPTEVSAQSQRVMILENTCASRHARNKPNMNHECRNDQTNICAKTGTR